MKTFQDLTEPERLLFNDLETVMTGKMYSKLSITSTITVLGVLINKWKNSKR
jgi:hypothetical protein